MKTERTSRNGFTLVEVMIVMAIIALLAAIALPNIIQAREESQKKACIANLKQIETAKETWKLEYKKQGSDVPVDADLFGAASYIKGKLECPTGAAYVIGALNTKPTCSVAGHTL